MGAVLGLGFQAIAGRVEQWRVRKALEIHAQELSKSPASLPSEHTASTSEAAAKSWLKLPRWAPIRMADDNIFTSLDREYAFLLEELKDLEALEVKLDIAPSPPGEG